MTGATTEVLMDGKPMRFLRRVSFDVSGREIAIFTFEMFADLEVDGSVVGAEAVRVLRRNAKKCADKDGMIKQLGKLEMDYASDVVKGK